MIEVSKRDHIPSGDDGDVAAAAAAWLSRRDRGLTAAEQDEFHQWLHTDPRHRAEIIRIGRAWSSLDALASWQPADGTEPNPDLLAPAPPRKISRAWVAVLAVGCAAALLTWLSWPRRADGLADAGSNHAVRVIPAAERVALTDGSVAEIGRGAKFAVAYAADERRVQLRDGKVHFTVAKNAHRPFLVEAGEVVVRAVGTAFSVNREGDQIEVLVTEGEVRVETPTAQPVAVGSGQGAQVERGQAPLVVNVRPQAIAQKLSWRQVRLEFDSVPLSSVVEEFNLRNARRRLVIGDERAGRLKVTGAFSVAEPEAFARLVEVSFRVLVDRQDDMAWVLRSPTVAEAK